jgi:hypothetical protein
MMITLMILLALVVLGVTNWLLMTSMQAEHEGVEAELDQTIKTYKDYIALLKARKQ